MAHIMKYNLSVNNIKCRKKKHHGAVDESSSEQQFHKLDAIIFVV